ncbi:SDR family NAD(P)-dependent oxidoreductase [Planotetraspora phitsanulokensis]|uniref:Oxidoreductase n=1 Tax=Planotetraspora phitsanulokensis TaxID=575192 RepID=A0A8J3U2P8_9ACTN|nr:SDR family oxidoreductase [Planotetraspora phitsanulokensis]GII37453.1 oxidoreductase [Planotetraspora phitsanulokensis]
MNRFEDRNVLLTGAGSGIGRATAVRLLSEGATVFAVDRDEAGLAETGKLAGDDGRFLPHVADLAEEEGVVSAAAAAVAALERVDVLVNVAGVLRVTPMDSLRLDDYREIFAVNVFAPVVLCREVLPHVPDRTGVVVNVTSTAATKAHPWMTGYAASKGALLSFSISLAAELSARRIRVVPVSPGGVATPLTANRQTYAGIDTAWYARTYPLWGRPGRPEDVAGTIAFAASADGAYLNGVEVRVDGGSHS